MKKLWVTYPKISLKQLIASGKPGDIIGCSGACIQSDFINVCTYGCPRIHLSHLMILAEDSDDTLIFESTTQCGMPCAIRGEYFSGTQAHYIGPRLNSYRGKIWHYPLVKPLRSYERERLSEYLVESLGIPYDASGAAESGGKIWAAIQGSLHPESLSSLFCSEWVAAALREIERFDTISASVWSPNSFIRECFKRGILQTPRKVICEKS